MRAYLAIAKDGPWFLQEASEIDRVLFDGVIQSPAGDSRTGPITLCVQPSAHGAPCIFLAMTPGVDDGDGEPIAAVQLLQAEWEQLRTRIDQSFADMTYLAAARREKELVA